MLNQDSQEQLMMNGFDQSNDSLSIRELNEFDRGNYTVTYLPGSSCVYKMKSERSTNLMNIMNTYRKKEHFCDVILCVQGEQFPAHKIVLASSSSYFASMFSQSTHIEANTTQDIDMTKLVPCPMAMGVILDFLYTSQVQINDKSAMSLLTSSMPLLLEDLKEICIAYLYEQLHASNCVGLFLYAKQYQCDPLLKAAEEYILNHFEEVVRHEEFLSLSFNDITSLIKQDKLKVPCESIVYNAAMLWYRHDKMNRLNKLQKLLSCVRLQYLGPSFVCGVMNCDEFASPEMRNCFNYLSNVHDDLISHRYCHLPPRRAPIKPLVIYCVGGYSSKSINTMECYFPNSQKWKRCSNFQLPRSGVGVVSLSMRVYVIGGRHTTKNENKDCREVERYDPFINTWMSMPSLISARNRLGVGVIDLNIYAVGGSCGQQIFSSVERFSTVPEGNSWTEVTSMNVPRIGLAVCTQNRLLYAIGGYDGRRRLVDVESYNPDTNAWTIEPSLRVSRSGAAATSFCEFIYVVGGYSSESIDGSMQLNLVERFDIIARQWTFVTSMNSRRSALSCVTLDSLIFAIGGYNGKDFSSDVEIYDPEKDQWTYGTPLTRERSGHGSALTVEPTLEDD